MSDDRNMRIASKVALVAIALGLALYFVKLGIGLATGFHETGSSRDTPQYVWTMVSFAFSAAHLVSWWFLARSSLNGAKLLFVKVATFMVAWLLGSIINCWCIARILPAGKHGHEIYFMILVCSLTLYFVFAIVDITVLAVLILKNNGRAKLFLSMFLAVNALGLVSSGLSTLFLYRAVANGIHNNAFNIFGASKTIAIINSLLSTAAWLLVYGESRRPAGCDEEVEEEEAASKHVPLLWRIFIVAIPLLVFTKLAVPGKATALLFFAPAGILRSVVDSNSAFVLLGFGYAVYLAMAVAILWSRTRRALLVLATAWALLSLLNLAGCATMLNRMHF